MIIERFYSGNFICDFFLYGFLRKIFMFFFVFVFYYHLFEHMILFEMVSLENIEYINLIMEIFLQKTMMS